MDKKRKIHNVKKVEDEKEEYKKNYLRALADYHNLEKRVKAEREETVKNATRDIVSKLLPMLDNIEKAEVFVKDEGLKIVKGQLLEILEGEGLQEIEVLGEEYDPHVAEAIEVVESDKNNIVLEVFRKGYSLNGKVLRHAQVKVGRIQ
ncbi:nucleotide exchange factor GrpE [Candidatus Roizmanbacteria bacterium]|nr:nucleotide exchange factor GrpE [Candidatus Roizmanbacteria bacterium]